MSRLAEIEVLLFVAGEEGLTVRNMAEMLELQPSAVIQQLEKLSQKYQEDSQSGLAILESSNRYKLVTKKEFADLLRTYAKTPMNQSMSRALLETLSIIAYKQPITRIEVDSIRGVNSSGAISKLQAFDLIRENGKKEVLGRPNLYITTEYFLDYMGINQLEELPDVSALNLVDEETELFLERKEIEEDENQ
ncbi:segregation and condensation protein B [Streptococcus azizii]|uniref:Segregation and condensation protein B n=1 Tax=Streptococcus azizii TaxID=1579424 RepID=A0AB36JT18_9STRE|nr:MULTISPECIES: SMC-Scp complex subunit ScpB [Streptococcus]MBF0775291.1 segregation/condensation protein B [Streptococcus sp. 19428wD3_AN2]ONK29564.1 segregation and condensation protein B [Streptococcus azizii]ONK30073.1 segregation and condensation protein B [Streptococcus azizii]ONK30848.1 segregation and condensation protein B [Streptococcus azizii]TFU84816.1 segregation/condensation protein B [Streptococcus sp. AN2]